MKKFLIALTMLATLATATLANDAETCLTVEQDFAKASEAGITEAIEVKGADAATFMQAFVKVTGQDIQQAPTVDLVILRSNPDKDKFFVVLFKDGCFVLGGSITEELLLNVNKTMQQMKADNNG